MKNKFFRTFAVTLASVLCLTAFSTTAFAGGADPDPVSLPEETGTPTTGGIELDTEDAEGGNDTSSTTEDTENTDTEKSTGAAETMTDEEMAALLSSLLGSQVDVTVTDEGIQLTNKDDGTPNQTGTVVTNGGSKRKIKKSTGGASIPKMALANLGRNKKRTVTVICSLTLGLVLLSCVYAKNASFDIDKYMSQTVISDFEVEDSSISSTFGTYNPYGTTVSPELVQNIEGLSGLEATGRLYSQVFTHQIGASALENIQTYYNADDRLAYIEATDAGLAEAYHDMIDSEECVSILYGVDGLILDTFAQDGRILDGTFDKDKFLSGGYVVMEAATGAEDSEKETQPTYSVGDMVDLNGQQYEVMAIVADIPTITEGVNSSTQDFLSFYLPADTFQSMYPDNTLRKLFFDVAEEYQSQAEEMLIDYRDNVDKSLNYTAKSTLMEHYQEQTRANTVMGFAISLIIAFVGILNFINSMLTAIVSRQKEFAMIQSIGMTKRQLRSMLIDEGLYYAGSTLLASYVLGALAVGIGVRMMVAGGLSFVSLAERERTTEIPHRKGVRRWKRSPAMTLICGTAMTLSARRYSATRPKTTCRR